MTNLRYGTSLRIGLILVRHQHARDVEFGTAHDLQSLADEGKIFIVRGPANAITLDVLILGWVDPK